MMANYPDDLSMQYVLGILFINGWTAFREGRIKEALQIYDELLSFASLTQDKRLMFRCQLKQAACFNALGDNNKALQHCILLLEELDGKDYPVILAETYSHLGHINRHLGQFKTALYYYEQSIKIHRDIEQRLQNPLDSHPVDLFPFELPFSIGTGLDRTTEQKQAVISNASIIGADLMNAGIIYRELGDLDKSLEYLLQALSIYEKVEADIKLWLAEQSVPDSQVTETLLDEVNVEKGNVLHSIANVYYDRMEWEKALAYYGQGLSLHQSFADQGYLEAVAADHVNIGNVYADIAHTETGYARAIDSYEKAQEIYGRIGNKRGEATTYQNIAIVYGSIKKHDKKLDYLQKALTLFEAVGDRVGRAQCFTNIGYTLMVLGELEQALDYFNMSLAEHNKIGDARGTIIVTENIGAIMQRQLRFDKALSYYQNALTEAQKRDLPELIVDAYAQIGSVHQYQRDLSKAHANYAAAIQEMGRVRGQLKQIEFRIGVFAHSVQVFERIVQVALDRKQTWEAYNRIEQAKSRTFLDLLGSSYHLAPQADLADISPLGFPEVRTLLYT
jgi:tetratricopeptide (TPR) repeat protein